MMSEGWVNDVMGWWWVIDMSEDDEMIFYKMIRWGVELMMVMDEGWEGDDWLSVGWPDIVWWWYGGEDDMRRQEIRERWERW